MAIASVTEAAFEPKSFSKGPVKFQLVEIVINSGSSSGTVTASKLKQLFHIILPGIKSHTAAPTYATNVATLAFTVPTETAAARTIANITYTAVANEGVTGNSYSITIVDGSADSPTPVVDGGEVVTVSGTDVTVRIDPTVVIGSTKQHVVDALTASAAASALFAAAVAGGHETDVCPVATKTLLTSGVSGGYRSTAICIGR